LIIYYIKDIIYSRIEETPIICVEYNIYPIIMWFLKKIGTSNKREILRI